MTEKIVVKEVVNIKYQCECGSKYTSKEEAEKCAAPIAPKFKVGDLVEVNQNLDLSLPTHDHGYGDESPGNLISKGSIARINGINETRDGYRKVNPRHPQQSFYYTFDNGDWPMRRHSLSEEYLTQASKEKVQDRIMNLTENLRSLENIVKEL